MPSPEPRSNVGGPGPVEPAQIQQQSTQGCLVRLFWIAAGNVLLLGCAGLIAKRAPWSFSVVDIGYWSIVALLVLARFVDIRRLHGETSNGEPATMAHFGRYAAGLPIIASAVWALAHSVDM